MLSLLRVDEILLVDEIFLSSRFFEMHQVALCGLHQSTRLSLTYSPPRLIRLEEN